MAINNNTVMHSLILGLGLSAIITTTSLYAQDDPFAELEAELGSDLDAPVNVTDQAPATNNASSRQRSADAFSEMEAELDRYTETGQAAEEAEFLAWKQQQEAEFQSWKEQYFAELNAYKSKILKHWDTAEVTDQQTYVEYSEDMRTRRVVDYENNEIRISIQSDASEEAVKAEMVQEITALVDTTPNEARAKDPVLAAVDANAKSDDQISNQSLLSELTPVSVQSSRRDAKEIQAVVDQLIAAARIQPVQTQADPALASVREITIPLPTKSTVRRAKKYRALVAKYASQVDIEPALVYAIMQTESAFNPMARSAIPAFGLMQIVPGSAGIDVAMEIYGERRTFKPDYLYDAENNIQAGSTYLKILYFRYLRKIEDPESRWYCAIAAYNTGAGNVSRAFAGTTRLPKAIPIINSMAPDEVYKLLIEKLPYDETKQYLKKVVSRRDSYRQVQI